MAQSAAAANRVYQDFEPFSEWTEDEASATVVLMLPGFTKEQLRVQVTSTAVLRINGERQVIENIWRRFAKEFPIPSYCDTNEVSAKFELGVLSIKFPKLITPAATTKPQEQEEPITNPSKEEETPMPQKVDEEGKEPIISDEKEKKKTEIIETPKGEGKKKHSKMIQRLKTRMLDFNISLRSAEDKDGGDTRPKRWKMLLNIIVAILLILVIGVYVKNAFRFSSQGEYSKFHEF